MNNNDSDIEFDEKELQEELREIDCDSQCLFEESQLFQQKIGVDLIVPSTVEQISAISMVPSKTLVEEKDQEKNKIEIVMINTRQQKQESKNTRASSVPSKLATQPPKSIINLVKRTTLWAEQRKNKILEGQREKHRKEVKECSFKPRLNVSHSNERMFNNISNLKNKENLSYNWKEETLQSEKLKKFEVAKSQFTKKHLYQRRVMPLREVVENESKQKEPDVDEYILLVEEADELFKQLKRLKEANKELLNRIKRK